MQTKQRLKKAAFTVITKTIGDEHGRVLLPVLRGPAKGLRFRLDLQNRTESPYLFGNYDLTIVRQITKICQKSWTVWDCGSYLGFYTALFARLVGPEGRVVAFEPDPRNLLRTKENIAMNKFNNVQLIQSAIGAPMGEIDFILSDNTNSHIPGTYVGATLEDYRRIERQDALIRVPCMSLDEVYLNNDIPKPDLVKLDIEGAEKEALQYAHHIAREIRTLIMLELHNPDCDKAAWEFAQTTGYSLQSLTNGKVLQKPEEVKDTVLFLPTK